MENKDRLSENQAKMGEEKSVGTEDDDFAHHHHDDNYRNFIERDPEIEDVCKDDSQEKSENINDDKKQVTTLPAPYLLPNIQNIIQHYRFHPNFETGLNANSK